MFPQQWRQIGANDRHASCRGTCTTPPILGRLLQSSGCCEALYSVPAPTNHSAHRLFNLTTTMPDDSAQPAQAAQAPAPEPGPAVPPDVASLDALSFTALPAASVARTNALSKMRSHRGNIPTLPQTKLCPLCPAKFTRTTHLNRHLKTRKSVFSIPIAFVS